MDLTTLEPGNRGMELGKEGLSSPRPCGKDPGAGFLSHLHSQGPLLGGTGW